VNERYTIRLHKRLKFEEKKQANRKRLLSDSETVRWLNHAVEKIWPLCMEQIASQKFLLPIIPWFLEKYKPWTAKKAVIQHLYLGRNPPMFTEIRVVNQSADDDHLIMELGMNFLSGNDMDAILGVKLRKRFGFGMWARMHVTGMHVEGRVVVGVKFLRCWPFIQRLRICFVEPPYFQMTVKPIFSHGLDVTELPGIAGWLDKLLAVAFGQTLVQPNMLVVDVEKLVQSTDPSFNPSGNWFDIDEKQPIAFAKVEIIEAAEMKPSDPNGLADPYVRGHMGPYRFKTKVQKKTLAPKWQEDFKIPICTWESPNMLILEVLDKDHFYDDTLGDCSLNISDLRGGQRHDKWLPLKNIKKGRLHIAVTILDAEPDGKENPDDDEPSKPKAAAHNDIPVTEVTDREVNHTKSQDKSPSNWADEFEPLKIDGQDHPALCVYRPGSDTSQTWEPRKGKAMHPETLIHREDPSNMDSPRFTGNGSQDNETGSEDDNATTDISHKHGAIARKLRKIQSIFCRSPKSHDEPPKIKEERKPLRPIEPKLVSNRAVGVMLVLNDVPEEVQHELEELEVLKRDEEGLSPQKAEMDSSPRGVKEKAKSILRQAGKSAHGLTHVLSKRGFDRPNKLETSSQREESKGSTSPQMEQSKDKDSASKEYSKGMYKQPNKLNPPQRELSKGFDKPDLDQKESHTGLDRLQRGHSLGSDPPQSEHIKVSDGTKLEPPQRKHLEELDHLDMPQVGCSEASNGFWGDLCLGEHHPLALEEHNPMVSTTGTEPTSAVDQTGESRRMDGSESDVVRSGDGGHGNGIPGVEGYLNSQAFKEVMNEKGVAL
ncbi:hypothetical protein AMTR_s00014p00037550, partial [Amborella trichopoda]